MTTLLQCFCSKPCQEGLSGCSGLHSRITRGWCLASGCENSRIAGTSWCEQEGHYEQALENLCSDELTRTYLEHKMKEMEEHRAMEEQRDAPVVMKTPGCGLEEQLASALARIADLASTIADLKSTMRANDHLRYEQVMRLMARVAALEAFS